MAILNEIEAKVDEIMRLLDDNDCEEVVAIRASRNIGIMTLHINEEVYKRRKDGKWEKII